MKSFVYLAAGLLLAMPAGASVRDARIDGAKLCTQQIAVQEQQKGLPNHVLAAIANTESGRWNKKLGMVLPWPWTINAKGKGYYFDSKAEAIAKVRALKASGINSIDVGCMQVNLRHHPDAFANLNQAFEPRYNVAYAAKFLRRNYEDIGNWGGAIAAYHSRTPKYGNKYRARVQKALDAITGKVRTARRAISSASVLDAAIQPESPSYRVIEIGKDAKKRKSVRTIRPQGSRMMKLAMRDEGASKTTRLKKAQPSKGFAIRPQDRLTSTPNVALVRPSYKRISVSGAQNAVQASTLVRSMNARHDPAGAASVPLQAKTTPPAASKPKFIFVD